jgi:RNA polymerase sigma-70 factor (ECF subfamily)
MKKHDAHQMLIACITEHKADFYRLAFSYVKNQEDALDIVQESIKKALISIDSIKDIQSIKSWLYKIVVRTAIDFLRKHKRLTLMDDEALEYLSRGREDQYEDMDLKQAMDQLPVKYKTIIILRFFEAEIIEENINTVKTRLYRALKLLRITMTEEDLEQ